jgi:hypothetical protein
MRHKASPCEASLYVFVGHRGEVSCAEGTEELELADMCDIHTHQILNLAAVRLL